MVIASKFGMRVDTPVCGTPEYVRACCEASLERLQTDYIDLYYQHRCALATSPDWRARAVACCAGLPVLRSRQPGLARASLDALCLLPGCVPRGAQGADCGPGWAGWTGRCP